MSLGPKISLIVVSHPNSTAIRKSLEAVLHSGSSISEIILVGDDLPGDVANLNAELRFIKIDDSASREETSGARTEAINRVARDCKSDYLALIDGNTEIEDGWLNTLIEFCEREPDVGAVGGRHALFDDDNPARGVAHTSLGPLMVDPDLASVSPAPVSANELHEVAVLTSDALLIRGQAVRALMGPLLDPIMESPYRELDLCARIMSRGWRCFYVPEAVAWSPAARPQNVDSSAYHYRLHRDRSIFRQRHYKWVEGLRFRQKSRKALRRDLIRVPALLMNKNPALRGRMSARHWLLKHRKEIPQSREETRGASYSERARWAQSISPYYGHERPEILTLIPK